MWMLLRSGRKLMKDDMTEVAELLKFWKEKSEKREEMHQAEEKREEDAGNERRIEDNMRCW